MKTLIHRFLFQNIKTPLFLEVFLYFGKKRDEGQSAYLFFSIESGSNIPTVRKSTDNINPRIKLKKGAPIFSNFFKTKSDNLIEMNQAKACPPKDI